MESIISISAAIISISCAIYCTVQVNFIKKHNKSNGNQNVQMNDSSRNYINTGNKYRGGDRY